MYKTFKSEADKLTFEKALRRKLKAEGYKQQTVNRHVRITFQAIHHSMNKPFMASKKVKPEGKPGYCWNSRHKRQTSKKILLSK